MPIAQQLVWYHPEPLIGVGAVDKLQQETAASAHPFRWFSFIRESAMVDEQPGPIWNELHTNLAEVIQEIIDNGLLSTDGTGQQYLMLDWEDFGLDEPIPDPELMVEQRRNLMETARNTAPEGTLVGWFAIPHHNETIRNVQIDALDPAPGRPLSGPNALNVIIKGTGQENLEEYLRYVRDLANGRPVWFYRDPFLFDGNIVSDYDIVTITHLIDSFFPGSQHVIRDFANDVEIAHMAQIVRGIRVKDVTRQIIGSADRRKNRSLAIQGKPARSPRTKLDRGS
jgi:hypothetical protein